MKTLAVLVGIFLSAAANTCSQNRIHIFVDVQLIWSDAQSYCRQNYRDLSTITSLDEQNMLKAAAGGNFSTAWIGLYRKSGSPYSNYSNIFSNNWMWSDGTVFWYNILGNENGKSYNCVFAMPHSWQQDSCQEQRPFFCYFCYFHLIVPPLTMTWLDALMYCRSNYIDLGVAVSQGQLIQFYAAINNSKADVVWVGLRFLAGEWLWVSKIFQGSTVPGSLPSCPVEPNRCGVYNKNTAQWETRDCDATLNFICY